MCRVFREGKKFGRRCAGFSIKTWNPARSCVRRAGFEKNFKNPAGNITGGYQWPRLAGGEGHEIEKRIDRRQGY